MARRRIGEATHNGKEQHEKGNAEDITHLATRKPSQTELQTLLLPDLFVSNSEMGNALAQVLLLVRLAPLRLKSVASAPSLRLSVLGFVARDRAVRSQRDHGAPVRKEAAPESRIGISPDNIVPAISPKLEPHMHTLI